MGKNLGFRKQFSWQDFLLWSLFVFVLLTGVWANYHYNDIDIALRATIGIFWLMALCAAGLQTRSGKRSLEFARQAYGELNKIVWPTRRETLQITAVVIMIVVILMFLLWFMDLLFESLMGWIVHYYS